MTTSDTYAALASPIRRRLLEILADGPRTAGYLAGQIELSRPAVSEHLAVLRKASLVRDVPSGRERYYHLEAEPLVEVRAWLQELERYWRDRLEALGDVLDALEEEEPS